MKKVLAFLMGFMLMVGISACTCTRQNQEVSVDVVETVDSTDVTVDTTVVGYVAGEENVAL